MGYLLVILLQVQKISRSKPVWKRKTWEHKDPLNSKRFRDLLSEVFDDDEEELQTCNMENNWELL